MGLQCNVSCGLILECFLVFAGSRQQSRLSLGARLGELDLAARGGRQAVRAVLEPGLAGEHVALRRVVAPQKVGRDILVLGQHGAARPVGEGDRDGEARRGGSFAGAHLNVVGLGQARDGVVRELSDRDVGRGVVHPVRGRRARVQRRADCE
jgi:hypothetical protein